MKESVEIPSPHLSLADQFALGDFSLRGSLDLWASASSNPEGISVREWTMQLLQRYRFVQGTLKYLTSPPRTLSDALLSEF